MLTTIQIVALLQGAFLILILIRTRKRYKGAAFGLLLGGIVSVILFLIGDDQNNLFFEGVDFFFFDSSLFITFLFLLFRHLKDKSEELKPREYLYFLPNIGYLFIEIFESVTVTDHLIFEFGEIIIDLAFLGYLFYIIFYSLKNRKKGIFYFAIPISVIFGLEYLDDVLTMMDAKVQWLSQEDDYRSYFLVIIAFLFYFISYYLILKPKQFLPLSDRKGYQRSNLNPKLVDDCKTALIQAMEQDKLFKKGKLSIHFVSDTIGVPRQYISEVLNIHMQTNFQDFVNTYRVQEFIKCLESGDYQHYTLFGIANEVGFNTKSTFNATFKKIHGTTPQAYRNKISQE